MVDIILHNTANDLVKASAGKSGTTAWLSIRQGDSEITIYGREDKAEAIRMIADVFNDAFQPKAETPHEPAPQGPPTLEDSDIPW